MKKFIRVFILFSAALIAVCPVIFLLSGMCMGNAEIIDYIAPVLEGGDGYAVWRFLPQYPTLKNIVELLFDSPEFFKMFWNAVKMTG